MLDDEDLRKIVQAVRAVMHAEESVTGEIGDRWTGGHLVLKPGRSGTQEKTIPIEQFFRKITAVRERLKDLPDAKALLRSGLLPKESAGKLTIESK